MITKNKDLLEYIFLRVDDSDINKLRSVCKSFKNIIDGKYFWMNKIIYKFPCLNYKLGASKNSDYKEYYFSLLEVFKEKNLHYISAIAQYYEQVDILYILSSYKNFQHSIPCSTYFQNKKIQSEFYVNPDEKLEGKYTEYHKNGRIGEICFYKNGNKEGPCLIKNRNGEITEFGNYKDGKKHGNYRYYENNVIEIDCNYEENILNGSFKTYIEGNLFEETHYTKSVQNGTYKEYYNNGNLKREGFYKKGKREGIWTDYDMDGNIINEAEYKDDIFVYL